MSSTAVSPFRPNAPRMVGTWSLDLLSGTAWRDEAHDAAFGYREMTGTWTFERFIAHVKQNHRDRIIETFNLAVRDGGPFAFVCPITQTDGSDRLIFVEGRAQATLPGRPPSLSGTVTPYEAAELSELLREASS